MNSKSKRFGFQARFWSVTDIDITLPGPNGDSPAFDPVIYRGIYYHSSVIGTGTADKKTGLSVRCVKDNPI